MSKKTRNFLNAKTQFTAGKILEKMSEDGTLDLHTMAQVAQIATTAARKDGAWDHKDRISNEQIRYLANNLDIKWTPPRPSQSKRSSDTIRNRVQRVEDVLRWMIKTNGTEAYLEAFPEDPLGLTAGTDESD